ncbi:MAG: YbgA family protein [Anaerolineaceae bacterium]|nr:YbgA family protein [Anaerolineaceae bacterium]
MATCTYGPGTGQAGSEAWDKMVAAYGALLMEGLSVLGTRGKHVNARSVQHLMGYLKNELSAEDTPKARRPGIPGKRSKQELLGVIEEYRKGMVPLIVPMMLLKHHLKQSSVPPALPTEGRQGRGVAAGVFEAVSKRVDAAESCGQKRSLCFVAFLSPPSRSRCNLTKGQVCGMMLSTLVSCGELGQHPTNCLGGGPTCEPSELVSSNWRQK